MQKTNLCICRSVGGGSHAGVYVCGGRENTPEGNVNNNIICRYWGRRWERETAVVFNEGCCMLGHGMTACTLACWVQSFFVKHWGGLPVIFSWKFRTALCLTVDVLFKISSCYSDRWISQIIYFNDLSSYFAQLAMRTRVKSLVKPTLLGYYK